MRVGIVGYGVVGQNIERTLASAGIGVCIYDQAPHAKLGDVAEINKCDLAFVAVPTPPNADGSCDISIVAEVVSWIVPPICIRSTIPPGTTEYLAKRFRKEVVFSPEYLGETPYHPSRYGNPELVVVGGRQHTAERFLSLYRQVYGPLPRYFRTDSKTAELAKYMENCFLATKVAFVAQFYEFATSLGIEFELLREIWLADTRIGRSHSSVIDKPGFSGKCLPKDLSAMTVWSRQRGIAAPLLEAVESYNKRLRPEAETEPRQAD